MNVNVFKRGYMSWRRPVNWGINIKHFFHTIKDGWQRATKGYADSDVWNLDGYLLQVLSGSLKHLADNHWGWPGNDAFPTDEDWTRFLTDMADKFYRANDENRFYPHPEEDKWWDWCEKHPGPKVYTGTDDNPFVNSMLEESEQIREKEERDFAEAWSAIGEYFWLLWD